MDERRNSNSIPANPRSVESQARSVDEAVQKALRELGLSRDEVEVEIIRPGSRGLLGLLGEDAVVRVTATPAEPAPPRLERGTAPAESTGKPSPYEEEPGASLPEQDSRPSPTASPDEIARYGIEALQSLLDHMGLEAQVTQEEAPPAGDATFGTVLLNITGPDLGVLIGRQGETLRDLQFVTNLIVTRRTQSWPSLVVDVEHYKSRRHKSLVDLAKRMADRVRASGQPVSLEPMPPHERRMVHLALRDDPDVFTQSTGQDEKRKVMIIPKK